MSEITHRFSAGNVVVAGRNVGEQAMGEIIIPRPSGDANDLNYYSFDDLIDLHYALTRMIEAIRADAKRLNRK